MVAALTLAGGIAMVSYEVTKTQRLGVDYGRWPRRTAVFEHKGELGGGCTRWYGFEQQGRRAHCESVSPCTLFAGPHWTVGQRVQLAIDPADPRVCLSEMETSLLTGDLALATSMLAIGLALGAFSILRLRSSR